MTNFDDYSPFCSATEMEYIKGLASKLHGLTANTVTTAAYGGGVAELLNRVLPLLTSLGLQIERRNLSMPKEFLDVAKHIYNGLRDSGIEVTREMIQKFLSYSATIKEQADRPCDLLFIHDHHPITLIESKNYQKAIWRCHVDTSHPDENVWKFLRSFVDLYDAAVFSLPSFSGELSIPTFSLMPSIDPLSDKNKPLPPQFVQEVYDKYNIPRGKPVIMQISRFDALKDPLGVIEVYEDVKKDFDCILVLAGGHASDDPTAQKVYGQVVERAAQTSGVYVLLLEHNDLEVNALQRGADIILQKSIKESFGLTITEALWKQKPVVATETGGIPLQIIEGQTGLFSVSNKTCATQIKRLLRDKNLQFELGIGGHKLVRENFLITRHVRDLLIIFCKVMNVSF
ncbi:trehalose synthase [Elusimicrobium posterum]|uniref:glycosyltransferase n=1 Tax=Elusimicrobium posterum TaxID=3116653 RepID=UPI003C712314